MALLVLSIVIVLVVSAICSLSEAALYAVRVPYVRYLEQTGSVAGRTLASFKQNMEQPISAILIINTAANTAGAAVAGAQAIKLFGPASLWWFSTSFTLAVLFMSEIMPKVVGVVHNRKVARAISIPLDYVIKLLFPLIWIIQHVSRLLRPPGTDRAAPEEELQHMAVISAEEGSILPYEAELVKNALHLNEITARDIMTPRSVAFTLSAETSLREAAELVAASPYSRIPVTALGDPETWIGIVMKQDILARVTHDQSGVSVESLCKSIYFVSEGTLGHVLLKAFVERRTHLFGVADQYGTLSGVVTLEDVVESIIGEEIVDETDTSVDMQELARLRGDEQSSKHESTDTEDTRE